MKKANGFTLVEILIVVVILAILASLILPRLLAQPERAQLAEAHQMTGAIRRALITYEDTVGSLASITTLDAATYARLGLQPPAAGAKYTYTLNKYVGGGFNVTAIFGGGNGTVALSNTGLFYCGGKYSNTSSGDRTKGCTI